MKILTPAGDQSNVVHIDSGGRHARVRRPARRLEAHEARTNAAETEVNGNRQVVVAGAYATRPA